MNVHTQRSWSWADWFVVGLRVFGFVMMLTNFINNDVLSDRFGYILTFAVLVLAIPQFFYMPGHIRPKWFIAAELIMSIGFALYLATYTSEAKSYLLLPMFVVSFMCTRQAFIPIAAGTITLLTLWQYWQEGNSFDLAIGFAVNLLVFSIFGFGFGVFMRQKHQLSNMLQVIEEKNRALEHSLQQIERMTLLEERNRMARELHDTVGHSLTASIVAMEAVHTLIDHDQESAKHRLQELITFNRTHLDQFRRTVHDMAMNELKKPLTELLEHTADNFSRQTGTKVVYETEGVLSEIIPEAVKLTMLRCLQESMTNAKKHGNAAMIQVTLGERKDLLYLRIKDNGSGSDELAEGFGIEGMKSRIEALRGTLQINSKKGEGTIVHCTIPIGVS